MFNRNPNMCGVCLRIYPLDHFMGKRGKQVITCKTCRERNGNWMKIKRLKNHNLSSEEYQKLLSSQNDSCAICKSPFTKAPHIDHCHKKGHVRGLLCFPCNVAIGHLKDDPTILQAALDYLS